MYSSKNNKMKNRKVKLDGITFDSVLEAKRYRELKMLERAGEITDLRLQVKYRLIPSQYCGNKCVERPVDYYADFVYVTKDGIEIVEDAKGMKTKDYIIKRKLMLYVHGITVKEVTDASVR